MTIDRIQKRYFIAAAVITGVRIADAARQVGVSRSWASREAHSAGVRNIIAEAIMANAEKVAALFGSALDAVEEALGARREYRYRGRTLIGGPDHKVRMAAVDALIGLAEAMDIFKEMGEEMANKSCILRLCPRAAPSPTPIWMGCRTRCKYMPARCTKPQR